ncbi:SAM-dependent methyltransferase, partial [Salmonella enterica]|nr:SAM-dependent methyltransferase [Salmonella enterica]
KFHFHNIIQENFKKIPSSPISYWVTEKITNNFQLGTPLYKISEARRGLASGNNEKFIREWTEVNKNSISILNIENANCKWFIHNKGGEAKRWYGNNSLIINWENNGHAIKNQEAKTSGDRGWRATSEEFYGKDGITWGGLTNAFLTFRWSDYGALFDTNKGPMMFPQENAYYLLGFLNSPLAIEYCKLLNPTISFQNADINR